MRINFHGRLTDEPQVRAGLIGCGSHSFRNVCPTFQFAPVELVATCDLDLDRARAFARSFGARSAYADYREMLEKEDLQAVFIVTSYDERGRPIYPVLAEECLKAGCHVWMEKPPAATCGEVERLQEACRAAGRACMVGFKKMFAPANEKAAELIASDQFGRLSLISLCYPQRVPTVAQMERYLAGERVPEAVSFLDHLCHPVSVLLLLGGMPETLHYERSDSGAGLAAFRLPSGAIASLALTHGASVNGGLERTVVVSDRGQHVVVENNVRLTLHRAAPLGYGDTPSFYAGPPEEASAAWEPEFSLGQLYNKGLFLLGYYGEVAEFCRAVLEGRPPRKGTLEHAWQATRIFEAFGSGPGVRVVL